MKKNFLKLLTTSLLIPIFSSRLFALPIGLSEDFQSAIETFIKNNFVLVSIFFLIVVILIILFFIVLIKNLNRKKIIKQYKKQSISEEQKVKAYTDQLENQKKEQEAVNQKLFAQKLEVEQRNSEVEQYLKQIEEQKKEQETINQKLFAQKLEVEQRNIEVEQYSKQIKEQVEQQDILNQQLFAQKLEVEQRNFETKQYTEQIEKQKIEQEKLNQKLFAQNLEVDQRRIEVERFSKELESLKLKAENDFRHLNDSINYAKTIVDTLLPDESDFNTILPDESFVLFRPKESIGGDFYYLNQVNEYTIFAVADCTGHGVPGALITMLGITFLNEIVEKELAENTGNALDILRTKIKDIFKSYGKNIQNKNGLDIALCAVNKKTNKLFYSGAFNPLYIFRDNQLIEYKSTRNPIGYYPVEKNFETHTIQLMNEDRIYLFSDGYQDQTGGDRDKKLSRAQFKDLLTEIHKYPAKKQKEYLTHIFTKWKGNRNQVDDVTIMGVKWKI